MVTNRCRANPNTSPDSPLDGESGEVFGFAPHLFVTKLLGSWVMNQPWHILASYASGGKLHFDIICVQKVNAFDVICSKGLITRDER